MKTKKSPFNNPTKNTKMSDAEIKKCQKLVADIGSGKANGFLYVVQPGERTVGTTRKADGYLLVHNTDPANIVYNLIGNLGINLTQVLAMTAFADTKAKKLNKKK